MPELPELEVLKDDLLSQIKGKRVHRLQILKPYILKSYFTGNLCGEKVVDIQRRGKFLVLILTRHKVVVHLMLRGALKYVQSGAKMKKTVAACLEFEDSTTLEISESGHKKRVSMYAIPKDRSTKQIENLGLEPLENDFTTEKLKNLLQGEAKQLKSFLRDQKKIAGIGNAYADEILWEARLSPFKITSKLSTYEIKKLHASIIKVLKWAIKQVREQGIREKRGFLNICQKHKEPCPRCGEPIQLVSFARSNTFYCSRCQTKGSILKDRRMSKFRR